MLTINGIYTDINESTYYVEVDEFKFYFSSNVYRDKFENRCESFCKEEQLKLELRYNAQIECKALMLFKLYSMIEKRGFRVEIDGIKLDDVPLFKIDYVI